MSRLCSYFLSYKSINTNMTCSIDMFQYGSLHVCHGVRSYFHPEIIFLLSCDNRNIIYYLASYVFCEERTCYCIALVCVEKYYKKYNNNHSTFFYLKLTFINNRYSFKMFRRKLGYQEIPLNTKSTAYTTRLSLKFNYSKAKKNSTIIKHYTSIKRVSINFF